MIRGYGGYVPSASARGYTSALTRDYKFLSIYQVFIWLREMRTCAEILKPRKEPRVRVPSVPSADQAILRKERKPL